MRLLQGETWSIDHFRQPPSVSHPPSLYRNVLMYERMQIPAHRYKHTHIFTHTTTPVNLCELTSGRLFERRPRPSGPGKCSHLCFGNCRVSCEILCEIFKVTHAGPLTLFQILQQMLQQRRTLQEHIGLRKEECDVRLTLQLTLQHPYTATHTATLIHCDSHCNSHCNTHTLQLTLQHLYTATHTATLMLSLQSSFFVAPWDRFYCSFLQQCYVPNVRLRLSFRKTLPATTKVLLLHRHTFNCWSSLVWVCFHTQRSYFWLTSSHRQSKAHCIIQNNWPAQFCRIYLYLQGAKDP